MSLVLGIDAIGETLDFRKEKGTGQVEERAAAAVPEKDGALRPPWKRGEYRLKFY